MHHPTEFIFTTVKTDLGSVEPKMKRFFLGIFVYFLAWGMIDAYFAVFLNNLVAGDYFLTSVLYALFFITGFVLFIPVGDLADKVKETRFIALVLLLYPLVGLLYFVSGAIQGILGLASFVVARITHSATSSWRVMMESFIRVNTYKGHASEMFGLYFTSRYMAQVLGAAAAVSTILLLSLTAEHLHYFFLASIPLALIAALIIRTVPSQGEPLREGIREVVLKDKIYAKEVKDFRSLGYAGRVVVVLAFGNAFLFALLMVFLPLLAESLALTLPEIGLVFILTIIPFAFSFITAELADHLGKLRVLTFGFLFAAALLGVLFFYTPTGVGLFLLSLMLGFALASIRPSLHGVLTDISPKVHDGEMSGIYRAVMRTSKLVSILVIGVLAQLYGITAPFLVAGGLSLLMAVVAATSGQAIGLKTKENEHLEGVPA